MRETVLLRMLVRSIEDALVTMPKGVFRDKMVKRLSHLDRILAARRDYVQA
jgi:hypothetical protein